MSASLITTIAVSVATTLATLRGVHVPQRDPVLEPTDTPPVVSVLLANAKADLRELATELLRKQPEQTAAQLQKAMTDALTDAGALKQCESWYGNLEPPKVTAPDDDILAVVVTLDIPCGNDASLFLFRRERGVWTLVLDRENNDYDLISGAAGSFDFRVSAPDAHGSRLVITSDIPPWCSSNWHTLRWEVRRINPGWRMPEVIDSGDPVINTQGEITLEVTPDTYAVDYVGSSICPAHVSREYHNHYRVLPGNQVERIDPIATSPFEYVEEWLLGDGDVELPSGEFQDPVRCRDRLWQIEQDPFDENAERTYFFVAEENGKFRMVSVGNEPHDGCKSEDESGQEKELHDKPPTLARTHAAPALRPGDRLSADGDRSGRNLGALQAAGDGQHE